MHLQSPLLRLTALASSLSPQASSHSVPTSIMSSESDTLFLFGGSQQWNTSSLTWKAVDDRVRGGSSQSYLDPVGTEQLSSAKFYGTLDTKTLGSAGFASRSTKALNSNGTEDAEESTWDLSAYDGLLLGIDHADDKIYTVTIKDRLPDSKRDDGREQSGVSWEADFTMSGKGLGASVVQASREEDSLESKYLVKLPWSTFKATYRGRDKPDAEPLNTSNIRRFALMARSFFEKQDGEFELGIDYIAASRGQGK